MSLGLTELTILLICCALPLILVAGAGVVFALIKWTVIGSYWMRGEEPAQAGGHYTLDQSKDVSDQGDKMA